MTPRELNRLLRRGRARAEDLTARMEHVLVPILNRAADEAARKFSAHATDFLTAAAAWAAPVANELIDVDSLVQTLRTKTDPVRQAVVETMMSPTLEGVGLSFDVTHPFTAKVLSQSGSQITHIAQTTQLNAMRIIDRSYKEGLSIPDTAKAIQVGMREASPARARLIARTELAGAVNGGSLAAVQTVAAVTGEAYFKQWLTGGGAKHPRHELYSDLDGQTVPLDGYFDVGGTDLEFPGDPGGPPDEVCNCRCALAYVDTPVGDVPGAQAEESLGAPIAGEALASELLSGDAGAAADAAAMTDFEGVAETQPLVAEDAQAYLDSNAFDWAPTLAESEVHALDRYQGSAYQPVNDSLRQMPGGVDLAHLTAEDTRGNRVAALIPQLDAAIAKDGIDETLVTYRGVRNPLKVFGVNNLPDLVGKTWEDAGFVSTSTDRKAAGYFGGGGAVLHIEVPAGAKGAWMNAVVQGFEEEREFLLPRGSRFNITGVDRDPGSNTSIVHARLEVS